MLYPLSYEGNYWVFNFLRGIAKVPAQPQHNIEEKVLRSSRYLSTIQTRQRGTERTLGSREISTNQGHGICTDRIPRPQDALRSALASKWTRILAKLFDQAGSQRRRILPRTADSRKIQRAGLGLQNWTPLFDEFFERPESGGVLSIIRRGSVATSVTVDAQELRGGSSVVRVQLHAPRSTACVP